ncbi:Cytochrome c oxidase subunit 4 [Ascosphaera aggregata]|nr:Cytochrome c oxidase subunit 4 [Ascosphaera aggregata]
MFAQRAVSVLARRTPVSRAALTARTFSSSITRYNTDKWAVKPDEPQGKIARLKDLKTPDDLYGPGVKPGEIPTDLDQATGVDRYELLHQMEGLDAWDMTPLESSRKGILLISLHYTSVYEEERGKRKLIRTDDSGTIENPIKVKSGGPEQYVGCSGSPAGSHEPLWIVLSKDRPIARCMECGSVYEMEYIGPEESHDEQHHEFATHKDPETFVDYVKPEYWHR